MSNYSTTYPFSHLPPKSFRDGSLCDMKQLVGFFHDVPLYLLLLFSQFFGCCWDFITPDFLLVLKLFFDSGRPEHVLKFYPFIWVWSTSLRFNYGEVERAWVFQPSKAGCSPGSATHWLYNSMQTVSPLLATIYSSVNMGTIKSILQDVTRAKG